MAVDFNPYFTFDGTARAAMEFYQSVFGGELTVITFADYQAPVPEEHKDLVMHAELSAPNFTLRASDGGALSTDAQQGTTNMEAAIMGDASSLEDGRTWFTALEDGASNVQPLTTAPWGDTFGSLTDKFGIAWMFNFSKED